MSAKEVNELLDEIREDNELDLLCRVEEVLETVEQSVVPAGMPLPENYGTPAAETKAKGGR